MSTSVLVIAVFLASAVEMVEALTIVLASGITRGWRSTFEGAFTAILVLTVLVLAFGPALVKYVPISTLRLVIGTLLIIFGLQWLRKAILRSSGYKEKRNEDLAFAREVEQLSAIPKGTSKRDSTAFTVSFKGVFLEGLEVVIIVLTLGASAHKLAYAAYSALLALAIVAGVGAALSRQLSSIPENAMKMGVALMLTSFGTFWSGEGLGIRWPGADGFILALIALYGAFTIVMIRYLMRSRNMTTFNEI